MVPMRRGLRDFVPASFPEPQNPIWNSSVAMVPNWSPETSGGVGDFVYASFPEPQNPIWRPGMSGLGCGGGCGCDSCQGMGAVTVPSWAASLPAPLNAMWGPLPAVYWGIGGLAALIVLPAVMGGGRRGRR